MQVKAGTARRVLGGLFPKSYTLEVSFYHYQKELRSVPYTEKSYRLIIVTRKRFNFQLRKLGENLARSLVEYYRLHPPI